MWNDPKTTMDTVAGILTQVFGLTETRAVYLMFTVHFVGHAVVASGARTRADALAEQAMTVARAKGFPLRFTVESAAAPTEGAESPPWSYDLNGTDGTTRRRTRAVDPSRQDL